MVQSSSTSQFEKETLPVRMGHFALNGRIRRYRGAYGGLRCGGRTFHNIERVRLALDLAACNDLHSEREDTETEAGR
jgi:hypothetical protein